jgi:hypothetical protein
MEPRAGASCGRWPGRRHDAKPNIDVVIGVARAFQAPDSAALKGPPYGFEIGKILPGFAAARINFAVTDDLSDEIRRDRRG